MRTPSRARRVRFLVALFRRCSLVLLFLEYVADMLQGDGHEAFQPRFGLSRHFDGRTELPGLHVRVPARSTGLRCLSQ